MLMRIGLWRGVVSLLEPMPTLYSYHIAGCQHSAVAGDFSRGPVTEHSSSHQCLIANAFLAWDLQKHLWQISLNSVETWCYIVLLGTFSAVALSRKRCVGKPKLRHCMLRSACRTVPLSAQKEPCIQHSHVDITM